MQDGDIITLKDYVGNIGVVNYDIRKNERILTRGEFFIAWKIHAKNVTIHNHKGRVGMFPKSLFKVVMKSREFNNVHEKRDYIEKATKVTSKIHEILEKPDHTDSA